MRGLAIVLVMSVLSCGKLIFDSSHEQNVERPIIEEVDESVDEVTASQFIKDCHSKLKETAVVRDVSPRYLSDGPYHWTTIPYTIDARTETIQLFAKVTLDLNSIAPHEREHYWKRIQTVRQCMRDFFLRHDIFLQLEFIDSSKSEGVAPGESSYVIVRKNGVRISSFNMSNWAFEMDGRGLSDAVACTVFTHEFGHMLGLRDEYEDVGRVRRKAESNSVMRMCQVSPEEAKFYPRHVRTIVKGACEEKSGTNLEISPSFGARKLPF